MNILGIETSCDETAASVVKNGKTVLSNTVASSLSHHEKYGGVIPEIASRKQLESIHAVVDEAITSSGCPLKKIDAIAVTEGPGLLGSLLVGTSYAKAVSFALKKPLMPVNHVKAHLYANFLTLPGNASRPAPKLPAIGLIVSGGHSSIYFLEDYTHYELLGQTRDDAAGEAFDKVARILGLGYPGGPIIDRLAKEGKNTRIKFSPSRLDSFDFSFSGTKTAVLYYHQQHRQDPDYQAAQVACSFQQSVISILIEKSIQACLAKSCKTLLAGGGVAANSALRAGLLEASARQGIKAYFPPLPFCMDNAAMVAGYAYHQMKEE
ncbi:MAG: tRNA (adenosine(37)-N6)-threonylcarbamoyltransferase complex transferase subunit TsaD [Candidatus Omnitrophota bacterium]